MVERPPRFEPVARVAVDPATARVHEAGWQSWSPSLTYGVRDGPSRPGGVLGRIANWRPGTAIPDAGFQAEGVLAIQPGAGEPVQLLGTELPGGPLASVRASLEGDALVVTASAPVAASTDGGPGGIDGALARWADRYAAAAGVPAHASAPTVWCSWYHYFAHVTEPDIDENLRAIDEADLPVEVVQVDDGYQAGMGDWLLPSDRFRSVPALLGRIRAAGRRAGLWVAPFIAGAESELVRRHPDWLVGGAEEPVSAGENWGQALFALDLTHDGVRGYLCDVFAELRSWGVDYFKLDFLYAGALPGRRRGELSGIEAYRSGLALIREATRGGYLVGCGAPLLPSVGLVDAMRVSPDTAPNWEPANGDMSEPGGRAAAATGQGRAWQHGRFWVNDPDCLIVRPAVEQRERWAAHVERYGGLRASSDRVLDLDAWGLATTTRLLTSAPVTPFVPG